ncbi:MAG: hypothetical protein JXB36_10475 [Gammaproteobacteria bacterium]|nr:hypothetical protein [Gammaproteobacteria bacterium]
MMRLVFTLTAIGIVGCGPADTADESANAEPAKEPTAFDPLVRSLERAEGVQQTIDEQAAAQRRRIEEAER